MSKVIVSELEGIPSNNYVIDFPANVNLEGHILQTIYHRTDNLDTVSALTTGNGTPIPTLTANITPKSANSLLVMQWNVNYEVTQEVVFLIHKNGDIILDSGYEGFNQSTPVTNRWNGYAVAHYDASASATPSNERIQYSIPAGNTSTQTFSLAVRASAGTAYTFYLNRTVGSTGTNGSENMVSSLLIWEIGQA